MPVLFRRLGNDIDQPANQRALYKPDAGPFPVSTRSSQLGRNAKQTIYRSQAAHNGHAINGDHGIGAFQAIDMDITSIAYAAIKLRPDAPHFEGIQNTGGRIFEEMGGSIAYTGTGLSVFFYCPQCT